MTKALVLLALTALLFTFAGCAAEEQSETTTRTSAGESSAIGGTSDVGTIDSGVGSGASAAGAAAAGIGQPGR